MGTDELIGANLARLRGQRSQQEVANQMRDRGWKWSQATMWSVEKGERPLRLSEAQALCAVLGLDSVGQLLGESVGFDAMELMSISAKLETVLVEFSRHSWPRFDATRRHAANLVIRTAEAGGDAVDSNIFRWLADLTRQAFDYDLAGPRWEDMPEPDESVQSISATLSRIADTYPAAGGQLGEHSEAS